MEVKLLRQGSVPVGYKQTEVGIIPEEWEVSELECVARIIDPQPDHRTPPAASTGEPYIGISDFINDSTVNWDGSRKIISSAVDKQQASFRIRRGDIIFGKIGTIGSPKFLPAATFRFGLSANVLLIQPAIEPYFVMSWLRSRTCQRAITGELHSTSQAAFGINKMRRVLIPLPNESERRNIAEALSDADAFIESLERLLTKKRRIKQGAMQELLTGKKRLPGFSGKWEVKRLGNTAILKARIGWQGLTAAEYLDSGDYYLVTGTEFKDGYIDWNNCHYVTESRYKQDKYIQLKEHDVLVTKDGTIGKVALITNLPKPATLNSGVFVIRPVEDAFHPEFFYYLLCSNVFVEFLTQLSAGSTINHLYQKDFVSFVYRTPPTNDEQSAIAAILSDMDAEIAALEAKLAKARQLKQGMMQELLTGKIRLV